MDGFIDKWMDEWMNGRRRGGKDKVANNKMWMCWYKVQERTFHEKLAHFDGNATCESFSRQRKKKKTKKKEVFHLIEIRFLNRIAKVGRCKHVNEERWFKWTSSWRGHKRGKQMTVEQMLKIVVRCSPGTVGATRRKMGGTAWRGNAKFILSDY